MSAFLQVLPLLGLSALAGVRLFATVFLIGLLSRYHDFGLVEVPPQLALLGHAAVLIVSGLMSIWEFCVDKLEWVDSLWDGLSTFIRPVGGAMLAVLAAWDAGPIVLLVCLFLGAGLALATHAAKASARAALRQPPNAGSGAVLSLGEDLFVAAAVFALLGHPVLALAWVLATLAMSILWMREITRAVIDCFRRLVGRVPLDRGPLRGDA